MDHYSLDTRFHLVTQNQAECQSALSEIKQTLANIAEGMVMHARMSSRQFDELTETHSESVAYLREEVQSIKHELSAQRECLNAIAATLDRLSAANTTVIHSQSISINSTPPLTDASNLVSTVVKPVTATRLRAEKRTPLRSPISKPSRDQPISRLTKSGRLSKQPIKFQ